MHVEKLSLLNFKNYEEATVLLNPRINLFAGKNGSGKTNLLDSIFYLSFTKSAFSASDHQCIRNGQNFFMVKGIFREGEKQFELTASVQNGMKKLFRENQVDYEKLSDHIGKYPTVLISPDDTDLIREGGELRRKFFDGMISQLDKKYLEDLIQYNHVIKQRNGLLRLSSEGGKLDAITLEAYDNLLVKYGTYIFMKRREFTAEFLPIFARFFSRVVEEPEMPFLKYSSALLETDFHEGLRRNRQRDEILQRTNFGIHRDDFDFLLDDVEIKKAGSQGQQKSFVIALKLAQYEIIEKYKGFTPILLLDDIFDKLDDFRITSLIQLIKDSHGQIFITDARPHRSSELLSNIGITASRFIVEKGIVTEAH
jgi:DNA replication and repair protein RecF